MATKTDKYELRKKEDNDFYNIDDFNDNMDKIETALTEFDDSGSADGITSFTDMLTKLVTGNKLAVTLRNLKAGLQFVLHAGSIVNNCVTDNAKLPLAAAQGILAARHAGKTTVCGGDHAVKIKALHILFKGQLLLLGQIAVDGLAQVIQHGGVGAGRFCGGDGFF